MDPPPRKRQRTTRNSHTHSRSSSKRLQNGALGIMTQMPYDILLEVFSHLNPLDVLHLSRTTKLLRNMLMSRTALSVWQSAIANDIHIPPTPDDMKEPVYVNLLFSEYCHNCLDPALSNNIIYSARTRLCTSCVNSTGFKGKYEHVHLDVASYEDCQLFGPFENHPALRGQCRSEVVKTVKRALEDRKGDPVKLHRYREQRMKTVTSSVQFVTQCTQSFVERDRQRERELEEIQRKRKEMIISRLSGLGYAPEIAFLDKRQSIILTSHHLVKQQTELTERAWTNMKSTLVEIMKQAREARFKHERKGMYKKRLSILVDLLQEYSLNKPPTEVVLTAADLCKMPEVQKILENKNSDSYTTPEAFEDFKKSLPELCQEWRATQEGYLLSLMPKASSRSDPLRLARATTYFQCQHCLEPISYPRILSHRCLLNLRHGYRNREDDEVLLFSTLDAEPWNVDHNRVAFHEDARRAAASVILACRLPPRTTTAAYMDNTDPWLECTQCNHRTKGDLVLRWRRAVLHGIWHACCTDRSASWVRLNDADCKIADDEERDAYTHSKHYGSHSAPPDFVCARCSERMNWRALSDHVKMCGGGRTVNRSDYYFAIDASIGQSNFAVTIPHREKPVVVVDLTEDDDDIQCLEEDKSMPNIPVGSRGLSSHHRFPGWHVGHTDSYAAREVIVIDADD